MRRLRQRSLNLSIEFDSYYKSIYLFFTGAGYAVIVLTVVAITYFSTIMALPILYMYHSLTSPLPWQHCGNPWNTEKCTEVKPYNVLMK